MLQHRRSASASCLERAPRAQSPAQRTVARLAAAQDGGFGAVFNAVSVLRSRWARNTSKERRHR
eukprot:3584347-Prymnesium_polylepis.1